VLLLKTLLVAVLLVGTATGCHGEPKPRIADRPPATASISTPSPTPTASASPSASSTPTASGSVEPAMPKAATKNSAGGAKAFARYFVDLVNYSGATGDTKTLASLSDPRCDGCTGLLQTIGQLYVDGGHSEGGTWSIGRLRTLPLDHDATWAGWAHLRSTPQLLVHGPGGTTSYPGGPSLYFAYLGWTSTGWTMRWLRTPEDRS
jgi:hypothetical protein